MTCLDSGLVAQEATSFLNTHRSAEVLSLEPGSMQMEVIALPGERHARVFQVDRPGIVVLEVHSSSMTAAPWLRLSLPRLADSTPAATLLFRGATRQVVAVHHRGTLPIKFGLAGEGAFHQPLWLRVRYAAAVDDNEEETEEPENEIIPLIFPGPTQSDE